MKQLRVFKKEVRYSDYKENYRSRDAVPESYNKEKKTILVYVDEYVEAEPLTLESLPKLDGENSEYFEAYRRQYFLRTIPYLKAEMERAYQKSEKVGKWAEKIYLSAYDLLYASPKCPTVWAGVPLVGEDGTPNSDFATGMDNVNRARHIDRVYDQAKSLEEKPLPDWMPSGKWNRKIYGNSVKFIYVDGQKYELSESQAEELAKIIGQ